MMDFSEHGKPYETDRKESKGGIALRDVPPKLHRAIKIGAAIRDLTMSEFILAVLRKSETVWEAAKLIENAPEEGREGEDNI